MTGKSHIGVGTCMSVLAGTGLYDLYGYIISMKATQQQNVITDLLSDYTRIIRQLHVTDIPEHNFDKPNIIFILLSILMLFIGFLLPDIDTKESMISRICRKSIIFAWLPMIFNKLEHHHWTHTCYFAVAALITGLLIPGLSLLCYLSFGYFTHLSADSPGRCGVCWFKPDYIVYPNGGRVKRHHKLKLYRTNHTSEYITAGVIYIITAAWAVYRFILL